MKILSASVQEFLNREGEQVASPSVPDFQNHLSTGDAREYVRYKLVTMDAKVIASMRDFEDTLTLVAMGEPCVWYLVPTHKLEPVLSEEDYKCLIY